ncbi:MAG: type I-E CRISPR-associated protein Cse1/CasA [Candidatus Omnitrophota bacterium]|nr:type I-E CRISPR-associated protein Cse1/CasA [Candidatus Omnitrophota bacterium]
MNLVTEKWVPVVRMDGKPDFASLMQIFAEGDTFADLSVRPHERVALMRLLICIVQAALDGPKGKDEWKTAPDKLPAASKKYLEQWKGSFELFDKDKPFLQIVGLSVKEKRAKSNVKTKIKNKVKVTGKVDSPDLLTPISKLDIALATGNKSTLFDHYAGIDSERILDEKQIAIGLITYQNFSASGRIGIVIWDRVESPGKGASFPAPGIDKLMLHTFLRGKNILHTIALNLLTKDIAARHYGKSDVWGRPVWEMFPHGYSDDDALNNATRTYLGRLVPISRSIKIRRKEQDMILANGFKYPLSAESFYETSATIKISRNKRIMLKVSSNAIWRELSAITVRNISDNSGARGPRALENLPNGDFDIWCGGIEWNVNGGYINSAESVYTISSKMLTEEGRLLYEDSVRDAEVLSKKVGRAVEEYRKNIDGFWEARVDPKKNKDAFKIEYALHAKVTRAYWTAVEKQRYLLTACVDAFGTDGLEPARQVWGKALHKAARDAYTVACGQETPRQIRAFALGWKKLFAEKKAVDVNEEQNTDGGEE